jgi:hypothetical protein
MKFMFLLILAVLVFQVSPMFGFMAFAIAMKV